MHIRLTILALLFSVFAPLGFCEAYDEAKAHTLFLQKCSVCHGVSDYDLGTRSLKEWQLVVERMSSYGGDDPYTDEEADLIIAYLYSEKYEPAAEDAIPDANDPPVAAVTDPVTPATATTAPAPKEKIRISWRKSKATGIAKIMGYVAAAMMALMVLTGLLRMKLKRNFRPIHNALAIGLFGALAIHVSIYLCEYGTPSVLWLWFGIVAAILIAAVEFGGLLRNKLGAKFIRIHSICGVIAFVLVILHWVWIYM